MGGVVSAQGEQGVQEEKKIFQLVCFNLADEQYAVDIAHVREVMRVPRITHVPQMPDFTLGVINLRGSIVPVFDLRKKFGLGEKVFDDRTKLLVAEIGDAPVSFIVDEILDNIKVPASLVDPSPSVKMCIKRECIRGVARLEDRMVIILDLDKVHTDLDTCIGDAFQRQEDERGRNKWSEIG